MPGVFSIQFDQKSLEHFFKNVEQVRSYVAREYIVTPERLAIGYADELRQAMLDEKYSYEPLTEPYLQLEKRVRGVAGDQFWIYRGELVSNITFWKQSRGAWHAGVPAGIKGERGRYLGAYGFWGEFGTRGRGKRRQPARPILGPTARAFIRTQRPIHINRWRTNLSYLWRN